MGLLVAALMLAFEFLPREAAEAVATRSECPLETFGAVRRPGDICMVEAGPNYTFTLFYPAEVDRIPALKALVTREWARGESDRQSLAEYALDHPDGRFFDEHVYAVTAARPELLALASTRSVYGGGAHGWSAAGELLWDRSAGARIEFAQLFTDPAAAFEEMRRTFCATFSEVQRREFETGGGRYNGPPCPSSPYSADPLSEEGERIGMLRIRFGELHGRAGGDYTVYLPVTPRLRELLRPRFQSAFQVSTTESRVCNPQCSGP